jgi:hypothetical protein
VAKRDTAFEEDGAEVEAVRKSLRDAGVSGVTVSAQLSTIDLQCRVGRTTYRAATVFRQADGTLHVAYGAKRGGGFKASFDLPARRGLQDLAARLLARRPNAFDPPTSLEEDVRALAASIPKLLRGKTGLVGDILVQREAKLPGAPFVWASIGASERKPKLKRAFDAASEVMNAKAGGPFTPVRHRRGLRARCWKIGRRSLLLWETDHDPSVGLSLHAGLFDGLPDAPTW